MFTWFVALVVVVFVVSIASAMRTPKPAPSEPVTYPRIVGVPDDARWSDVLGDWTEAIVEVAPRSYQIWKMDAAKKEINQRKEERKIS